MEVKSGPLSIPTESAAPISRVAHPTTPRGRGCFVYNNPWPLMGAKGLPSQILLDCCGEVAFQLAAITSSRGNKNRAAVVAVAAALYHFGLCHPAAGKRMGLKRRPVVCQKPQKDLGRCGTRTQEQLLEGSI